MEKLDAIIVSSSTCVLERCHSVFFILLVNFFCSLLVLGSASDIAATTREDNSANVIQDRFKGPNFAVHGSMMQSSITIVVTSSGRNSTIVQTPVQSLLVLASNCIPELCCLVAAAAATTFVRHVCLVKMKKVLTTSPAKSGNKLPSDPTWLDDCCSLKLRF